MASGVEEALRIMPEFLALAKAQRDLVLLPFEVGWRAQRDLGWEPQASCRGLKTLLVRAELRVTCLAQHVAHAVQLLGSGELRISQ